MNRKSQKDFEKLLFTKVLLINSHHSPILVLTTARVKPSQYIAQHLYEPKRESNCSSCSSHTSYLVRATNSKLLGTKILEVFKTFRVELENT